MVDDGFAVASINYRLTTSPLFQRKSKIARQPSDGFGPMPLIIISIPIMSARGDYPAGGHLAALLGTSGGVAEAGGQWR